MEDYFLESFKCTFSDWSGDGKPEPNKVVSSSQNILQNQILAKYS